MTACLEKPEMIIWKAEQVMTHTILALGMGRTVSAITVESMRLSFARA